MSEPFLAEIRIFSFNFAPKTWALCNGQLMPINQYQALFSLLGTMYGGDGRTTFALPNLQGQVPAHVGGQSFTLQGQKLGEPNHTLSVNELPAHMHSLLAKAATADQNIGGTTPAPTRTLAEGIVSLPNMQTTPANIYGTGAPNLAMSPAGITNAGGSQPHPNMQPFLALNFCIALQGIYPSRN